MRGAKVIATVHVMAGVHTPVNVVIHPLHRRNMLRALHVNRALILGKQSDHISISALLPILCLILESVAYSVQR